MDIYEQMAMRFDATEVPTPSEAISIDNEKLTQWYLEHAFFRDFVYRNPLGRKGREFSDALVVYGDTMIVIQNKTHSSARSPVEWTESAIRDALGQLSGSFRMIKEGFVREFENETLCSKVEIDLRKHVYLYGIIVIAQDGDPLDPYDLIRIKDAPSLPFNVMTLNDMFVVIDRMDTASDFITYFELRNKATQIGLRPKFNDEVNTMRELAELLPELMKESFRGTSPEVQLRTLRLRKEHLVARIKDREDYKFSILIDDIIARAHDVDPAWVDDLSAGKQLAHDVGQAYGFLDRERRIEIGKRLIEAAISAKSGGSRTVVHIQRHIGQVYLYFFSGADRKLRRDDMYMMSAVAQEKYGYKNVLAVSTEPVATGGRSYDFINLKEKQFKTQAEIPREIIEQLPDVSTMRQMIE